MIDKREEFIEEIRKTESDLKKAKSVKRNRDLRKHLFRLKRELRHYDEGMIDAKK